MHERADRRDAGRRKNLALSGTGIEAVRWRKQDLLPAEQIRAMLRQQHARIQERMKQGRQAT